jgi:23S rRNA (guanosine2251-2'-O)-methyltransferase
VAERRGRSRAAARDPEPPRRQLAGPREIAAALRAREPVRLLLAARQLGTSARGVAERARRAGIPVRAASGNDLRRMSGTDPPGELLGLVGGDPAAGPERVLAGGGAAWLVVNVAYPGNAGFAIRTAEVSGADGIFLDAGFDARGRRLALRASMHAERFLPVHWERAERVIEAARRAGRRVLALENVGERAPWEIDLDGPVLLVLGGEERGVPERLLARCDMIVRVPMAGFIPSYNLQAAMAAVAAERLRQRAARGAGSRRRAPASGP